MSKVRLRNARTGEVKDYNVIPGKAYVSRDLLTWTEDQPSDDAWDEVRLLTAMGLAGQHWRGAAIFDRPVSWHYVPVPGRV